MSNSIYILYFYLPNSALVSVFRPTDGTARIFHRYISFSPNLYDLLTFTEISTL